MEKKRRTFTYNGKRECIYVSSDSQREFEKQRKLKIEKIEAKRKAEADRAAAAAAEKARLQQEHDNPTLNAYYEIFTENKRGKVKESTLRSSSFRFRNCAGIMMDKSGRTLGEMRIRDIKPYDIQTVQRALEKSGRKTETVNNCMYHLSHVFSKAEKDEIIDRNPCKAIDKVKRTEKPARETIHRALTEAETKAFFEKAKGSYFYNFFVVMIQTGIRIGELGALGVTDIDSKGMMMHISKTVTKDEIGAYLIGDTPKTNAGNRDIPVPEIVVKSVKDQRALNRMLFGEKALPTIFRSPEGALLREYQANREIKRICKRAGIEKFTCHAFRATFATRFIEQRPQDYKVLSEILGHSNTKITLDLYTHVMKDSKIRAMNGLTIAI